MIPPTEQEAARILANAFELQIAASAELLHERWAAAARALAERCGIALAPALPSALDLALEMACDWPAGEQPLRTPLTSKIRRALQAVWPEVVAEIEGNARRAAALLRGEMKP